MSSFIINQDLTIKMKTLLDVDVYVYIYISHGQGSNSDCYRYIMGSRVIRMVSIRDGEILYVWFSIRYNSPSFLPTLEWSSHEE